jgi:hypothetical protein
MAERMRFRVTVPEGSALCEALAPLPPAERARGLVRLAERGLAADQVTDLGRIAAALERLAAGGTVSVGVQARPEAPDVGAEALARVRGLEAAFGDDLPPGPDAQA